jgi:tRNA pseudouridine38-40 synthase
VPTYRLDLAYDGTGFHGFARQPAVRTVQGELEAVLARVLREPVVTSGAGRTDAGVHARRQVVSFRTGTEIDRPKLVRAVGGLLGPEIAVIECTPAPDDFDARFSALSRSYRYFVLNADAPDPLRRYTTWHVADSLDLDAMNQAASGFVGEHDFASFCRSDQGRTTVREVVGAGWAPAPDDLVVFAVTATAFCHQMVRSLTGFCVDAGRGRVDPAAVPAVLAARDRAAARPIAPPQGLVLWEVTYRSSPPGG